MDQRIATSFSLGGANQDDVEAFCPVRECELPPVRRLGIAILQIDVSLPAKIVQRIRPSGPLEPIDSLALLGEPKVSCRASLSLAAEASQMLLTRRSCTASTPFGRRPRDSDYSDRTDPVRL